MRKRSRSKGYLLLEAVASIAIIAIGLAVILRSFSSSLRASKIAEEYFIATLLLNDGICELEEKAALKLQGLDGSEEKRGEKKEISNIEYSSDIEIKAMDEPDSLAIITAVISWNNGKRSEKIEAGTLLRYRGAGAHQTMQ